MSIIHSLGSFSLPKLFRSIDDDSRSGRLIVETPILVKETKREGIYYIWFREGYLIAVSNCLNQKGLINSISDRGWLSPSITSRLRTLCPTSVPLGIYLRKMKLLDRQQLSLVFQLQLHQVYRLFHLTSGRFRFDDFAELESRILTVPWLEMTGNRIRTTEVTMHALRLMNDWSTLTNLLPQSGFVLERIAVEPGLKLIAVERQLWNLADGRTSLSRIAELMEQSLLATEITAFRLMAVGLLKQSEYSCDLEIQNNHRAEAIIESSGNQERLQQPEKKPSLWQTFGDLLGRELDSNIPTPKSWQEQNLE